MIGQALGQVLSQAIGIAISPVPIILVIVVLFSRRAMTNAAAFLVGWALGVLAVFLIASAAVDGATDDGPSDSQGVIQLLLGLVFLALAVRQWRSRPAPGATPEPPAFLAKVETMGPAVALGLGLLLTAANPKNLALLVSAGAEVGDLGLDAGELVVVAVVFLLITMIGVAAPVVLTLALEDRAQGILHGWQDWLSRNNNTVMLVLFAVLAFKMLGSGIATLAARRVGRWPTSRSSSTATSTNRPARTPGPRWCPASRPRRRSTTGTSGSRPSATGPTGGPASSTTTAASSPSSTTTGGCRSTWARRCCRGWRTTPPRPTTGSSSADRVARRAIAQAYGHAILPLCNDRDLRTQIRWGLADFRHRFGREAEGLWLPETAVDDRVLAALAEEGVGFTILAPNQVAAVRRPGRRWAARARPAVDPAARHAALAPSTAPTSASTWSSTTGRSPTTSPSAGSASQVVVDRIVERATGDLVSVACDGESFGHHHTYADRGVAYALAVEADRRGVELPRLADWLADHPPAREGRVHVSAWSCAHGVARWMEDCGCHTGGEPGWNQAWRAPAAGAFDRVRDRAVEVFERRGPEVLRDPWAARDAYIELVLGATTVERLRRRPRGRTGDDDAVVAALTLLESQRHALLHVHVVRLVLQRPGRHRDRPDHALRGLLLRPAGRAGRARAGRRGAGHAGGGPQQRPEEGDGREIWHRHVEPSRVDPGRVAAHLALTDLLAGDAAAERHRRLRAGARAARDRRPGRGGRVRRPGRASPTGGPGGAPSWAYAAVHLGGLEVFGAVRPAAGDDRAGRPGRGRPASATPGGRAGCTGLLRMVVDRFGPREFGLESALPGVGEDLLRATAQGLADRFVAAYDQLRSDHHDTLVALAVAGTPLAPELGGPIELALARRLEGALAAAVTSRDPAAYRGVRALAREAREEGVRLSSPGGGRHADRGADPGGRGGDSPPRSGGGGGGRRLVTLARELALDVDMDVAQERIHEALRPGGAADMDRELLVPLARRLGVSSRPIDVHG